MYVTFFTYKCISLYFSVKERVLVGILTDDFDRKFSKIANWKCLSKVFGVNAPTDMI